MIVMFGINWISVKYILKPIIYFNYDGAVVKVAEAVFRTGIIVIIGLTIIYYTKISKEINEIIKKLLRYKNG